MNSYSKIIATTANPEQADLAWETFSQQAKGTKAIPEFFALLGHSRFLGNWALRNPKTANAILQENLQTTWTLQNYLKAFQNKAPDWLIFSEDQFLSSLLDFKYRHFFRVTLRDLGKIGTFAEHAAEISDLAGAIVVLALRWQGQHHSSKAEDFLVMGMGKLGGRELNYSSDLDLIYGYDGEKTTHEAATSLAQDLSRLLRRKDGVGFLYRIDLELRPEGKSGVLVNSIDALEDYYESFGATWEKQALIKSDCVAGSPELFRDFRRRVQAFVYPKTSDFSILVSLKEMKAKLDQSLQNSSQQGFHVKLGRGGIREIEFIVQSLQLLFAGKNSTLQHTNTLIVLERLGEQKILSAGDSLKLRQAYVFLRVLENRLQQVDERQTHRLPEDPEELTQIVRSMGYLGQDRHDSYDCFFETLDQHCRFVEQTFHRILSQQPEA